MTNKISTTSVILSTFEDLGKATNEEVKKAIMGHPNFEGVGEQKIVKTIGKAIYSLNKDGRIRRISHARYEFVSIHPQRNLEPRIRPSTSKPDPNPYWNPDSIDGEAEDDYGKI